MENRERRLQQRGLIKPDMPEENIQKWVAARLDGVSRGKYSVVREEEVDNYKKPDVRLFHQKAGRVGTEVKPTDRYSFSQLQRALKNQLVGQYLKDVNSRHGILLLANLKKRHWVPRDRSGRLSFPALVAGLNSEAARLVDRDNGIDSVSVIGIDFVGSN